MRWMTELAEQGIVQLIRACHAIVIARSRRRYDLIPLALRCLVLSIRDRIEPLTKLSTLRIT